MCGVWYRASAVGLNDEENISTQCGGSKASQISTQGSSCVVIMALVKDSWTAAGFPDLQKKISMLLPGAVAMPTEYSFIHIFRYI